MEIVRTFEDAFAVGSACLAKINHSKARPRLLDDYLLPLNLDDGPWEMSEEALYQTLSYIMNFLNHSCYMLCVNGDDQKMVKLETREMSQFFKDILMADVRKKQDAKINGALLDDKDRLKKMRIMQCVVKPYAASSGTSEEYNALFQKVRAPDGVYILNLTDAVLLRKNGLVPWKLNRNVQMPEAYRAIDKFIPVLSISGEEGYWDIPIPNYDDVEYVLKDAHPDPKYELDWLKKKSKAVFRGGPTGCGVSENTNMRIKLAKMGLDPKYASLLNVGIVSNKPDTIDSEAIRYDPKVGLSYMNTFLKPVARMPMSEQSTYKYIIHIDGNVHAYRLLTTMRTGSVILRVKSDYTSWIDHLLDQEEATGKRMYVPVRADLSDLISQIEYCEKHSDECKAIADRAKEFAERAMTMSYVINAVEAVMWKLKELLKPGLVIGSTSLATASLDKRYAIVGDDNETKEYFTKGDKDKQWHTDPLIQSIMKMNVRNSEDVLCVLQDMCFSTSLNVEANKKDGDKEECVSEEMAANKISTDLFKQFYHYFDDAYFLSKEELDHSINKEAAYSAQIYPVLQHIRNAEKLVNNNAQYRLGTTAILSNLPVSPIQEMVDLVLSDKDESRKRRLVINLVESQKYVYLGNPAEDSTVYAEEKQNEWWYYCVQSHVKLVPRFLYLLATAVIRNPRDYDVVRSNLIQEIGEQTDDGIFDKHTGVFIEGIRLVNTEVFDDSGFKVHTGAVLEKEDAKTGLAKEEDENMVEDILFDDFENEDEHIDGNDETTLEANTTVVAMDSIANTAKKDKGESVATGNKMLDLLNEQTFRITFSVPIVETFDLLTTELSEKLGDAYEQYLVKKPKEPYSRNDYMAIQETTYLLVIYIYMVELFLSKKQIMQKMDSDQDKEEEAPEKNKDDDVTELLTQYVARRLVHIFRTLKKQRKIWPAIYMKKVMESSNKHKSIAALVNLKRGDAMKEPMATRLKQSIAQELSLRYVEKTKTVFPQTQWTQFLPPQHPQDLSDIKACSELQRATDNKGKNHINTPFLFGKMIFLSFCIQRTIQEILNTDTNKDSLLLNIKVYNQMNSCCVEQMKGALLNKGQDFGTTFGQESNGTKFGTTLEFFNENSPNENLIQRYNVLVEKIEKQLLSVRSVTRSFLSNVDTEIPYPVISHRLNDEVMEEGLHFLSKVDVISLTDNKDLSLHQQFLQDYVKYSRLTLRGPAVFADVRLPVIQLIKEMNKDTDESNHAHFEHLSRLLQALYKKKGGDQDDNGSDDVLIVLKQFTANRMKSMRRPKQAQLEKIFKKIEPAVVKEDDEEKEDIDVNNAYATMTFLKNYVTLIGRVFPALFKNKKMTAELSGKGLSDKMQGQNNNSSWFEFSGSHIEKLDGFSKALYANASAYIKSSVDAKAVAPYFEKIMEKTDVFVRLVDTTYFQPSDKESARYLFMVYLALLEYYIASIFDIYDATAKRMLKEMEEVGDADEDSEVMQQVSDAKTALLDFSLFYLNKTAEVDVVNKAYQNIMDVVFKHKENEKNKFRKRLEKMSRDERIAYQDDRKLGIGEYNAKNYAGLKTYDAEFYDKTREVRDELQEQEDNFEEKESETMAKADGQEEDGDYNNEFEEDGYY